MTQFSHSIDQCFAKPSNRNERISLEKQQTPEHQIILDNFCRCILDEKVELIAPAEEGLKSVELANSMILSSFNDITVEMPLDEDAYEKFLNKKISSSKLSGIF